MALTISFIHFADNIFSVCATFPEYFSNSKISGILLSISAVKLPTPNHDPEGGVFLLT